MANSITYRHDGYRAIPPSARHFSILTLIVLVYATLHPTRTKLTGFAGSKPPVSSLSTTFTTFVYHPALLIPVSVLCLTIYSSASPDLTEPVAPVYFHVVR